MDQRSTAPGLVEPWPAELVMVPLYRMSGIEMQALVETWDPDPDAPWRAQLRNSVPGSDTWWRALFSGVPGLRTIKGRITSFVSHTNGHGPADFRLWSSDEKRSYTWFRDPPFEFSMGQPVEIDYFPQAGDYEVVPGAFGIPGVVLELRAGYLARESE